MAGDIKVAVVSKVKDNGTSATTDFTKTGFGTPKACIILLGWDTTDDISVAAQSRMSIGFSDFTDDFCIAHQDEDASAKVDCDAVKSNTFSSVVLSNAGIQNAKATASTITDGVRLTNSAQNGTSNSFATVIMFGGADLNVSLVRTPIASSQDNPAFIAHSGFTDGNDKLIFFIGTDISGEDSTNTGINNSFGVCHATGSDAGGWTFVQRALGWASDHNNVAGSPSSILSTDRVLDIITEAGGQDWGLEVNNLDHSPAEWTVFTRDAGSGAGMEVYSLALDLDDRKAKVGSVSAPTSGATWTPSVSLGFTPQYVGLGLTDAFTENVIEADSNAGIIGISSNTGSGEETCHSFYNENGAPTINTNNLFRSRAVDVREDDVSAVRQDHQHSSFNSGGWTYTINTSVVGIQRWFYWTIEEAAAVGEVIVAAQGNYTLNGQASNLLWDHKMPAVQGSYALNGQPAITTKGFMTVAAQGSYALNGQIANLIRTHIMLGDQGSYLLNGQAANLLFGHLVNAAQGDYSLTGFAATLSRQVTIVGAQGSYTLTGIAADLLWNHLITAVQGNYAYTGFAADTRVGFTMEADQGSYLLNGQASNLLWKHLVFASQGSYALNGQAAVTVHDIPMVAAQGLYNLSGQAAILSRQVTIIGAQGSYTLSGFDANLLWNHLIAAIQGNYTYTGFDAITFVTTGETLTAVQGSYILTGQPVILTFSGAAGGVYKPVFRPRRGR